MDILRSLIPFRLPNDDLLLIYKGYIRPLVEYAVPVWHSGLTTAQTNKLEGIQKRALKLILGYRYNSYANALVMTSQESLQERRVNICCKFGKSLLNSKEFQHWLPQPRLEQLRQTRNPTLLYPLKCKTERYRCSPIPFLVRTLNERMKDSTWISIVVKCILHDWQV